LEIPEDDTKVSNIQKEKESKGHKKYRKITQVILREAAKPKSASAFSPAFYFSGHGYKWLVRLIS
jgi:hypothetical protein